MLATSAHGAHKARIGRAPASRSPCHAVVYNGRVASNDNCAFAALQQWQQIPCCSPPVQLARA
jgi:hypothetical protein